MRRLLSGLTSVMVLINEKAARGKRAGMFESQ